MLVKPLKNSKKSGKMNNMFDIVTIGSATRDAFINSGAFKTLKSADFMTGQAVCFPLGSKIEITKPVFTIGGGGANTAVTFARQGLITACIGAIGQDINGQEILKELTDEGVETKYFQKHSDDVTAYSFILVQESGERTVLSYKGEGQHFDVSKVLFRELKTKWIFLDSLGGHFDLLEKSVNWAVANGVKLAANPGGKEIDHGLDKLKPLLKHFSVVIMNQEEAAKLTGIGYKKEEEIFKFMDGIIGGVFIMTKGQEGVVVSDGKALYRASVSDSPVVERTGAGDAFSSGFISEFMVSGDISKSIQFATANASSVVTQYGAIAGILRRGDWGPWSLVDVSKTSL